MDDIAKKLATVAKHAFEDCAMQNIDFPQHITVNITKGYRPDDPYLVEYVIGSYSDANKTQGAYFDSAVSEYMRRAGWTERNKAMVLIENKKADEDAELAEHANTVDGTNPDF